MEREERENEGGREGGREGRKEGRGGRGQELGIGDDSLENT